MLAFIAYLSLCILICNSKEKQYCQYSGLANNKCGLYVVYFSLRYPLVIFWDFLQEPREVEVFHLWKCIERPGWMGEDEEILQEISLLTCGILVSPAS